MKIPKYTIPQKNLRILNVLASVWLGAYLNSLVPSFYNNEIGKLNWWTVPYLITCIVIAAHRFCYLMDTFVD